MQCVLQINANDDRGVVAGRWDGEYSDGVAPTRWTGSVPILRRWSEAGGQMVRYGQCWVFTGVACSGERIHWFLAISKHIIVSTEDLKILMCSVSNTLYSLSTVLRCLGIPTRCITNYSSAHDTDANISVDYLFNDKLESVSEGRKDTIWLDFL